MTMVKFATTCDAFVCVASGGVQRCMKRSIEYEAWPTCRECLDHFCPEHQAPDSYRESDGHEDCLCAPCAELMAQWEEEDRV